MPQVQDVTIVEYESARHAKSIAEMWNRSNESWGGDNALRTEESVTSEHLNSPNLKVFLAVAGEEVVGYCSFSHYKEDTGALYIPLLNVRPDYHGKKVGKALVRRAIEETISLGWPRLDLYTWTGNTKAAPTYKKSGFFWEKRDDTTHLMNFIPSVLNTAAVEDYFKKIDWYKDSIREIELQPDGRNEQGFDYFTYEWTKDSLHLKMEYERTGRGLRLIETEDYLIKATIPSPHQLPFGESYPIVYEAVNKSGKPLTLQIKGIGNSKISMELNETRVVDKEERIEGSFFVHPVEEEQDPYQTHPYVESELLINGRTARFRLGIEPKFPVKLKLSQPHHTVYTGEQIELDLTVENEQDTEKVLVFELTGDTVLSFCQPTIRIAVPAKGRTTVTVPAVLQSYGIWHQTVDIHSGGDPAGSSAVQQDISLVFPGAGAFFGGRKDKDWMLSSGQYSVYLKDSSNMLSIRRGQNAVYLFFPQLGLPYTNEFKKQPPLQVVHYKEEEAMVLEARYEISADSGLQLTMTVKLYSNGMVTRYFTIHNESTADLDEGLFLKEGFPFNLSGSIIPYKGKFVDLRKGADASRSDYWEVKQLTENWMFAVDGETTRGITWPKELKLIKDRWLYALEHPLGYLPAGGTVTTRPLVIALGTWSEWHEFRSFALSLGNSHLPETVQQLVTNLNDGNPFVKDTLDAGLMEQKKTFLEGKIGISARLGSIENTCVELSGTQKLTDIRIPLTRNINPEADLVTVELDLETTETTKQFLVFPLSGQQIKQQISHLEQAEVLTADNGVLRIQASSDFAPALFSLRHHGYEWLDTSFPLPGPKSWWNPWVGGIAAGIDGMRLLSLMEEPRQAAFAGLNDNFGNAWSGIRMSISIVNHAKFRGLTLHHYFLLLPGSPVLASVIHIEPHTGAPIYPLNLETSSYYRTGSELKDSRGTVKNASREDIVYKAGRVQYEAGSTNGIIHYGSKERKEKLTLVTPPNLKSNLLRVNTHVIASDVTDQLFVKDGKEQFASPQFYILSDLAVPEQAYEPLFKIRFTK